MRTGGLYLIGNVKGCTKCFCKPELKEETPACERNKLVHKTKKITLGAGTNAVTVHGTGWRCTGDMVATHVHTGGATAVGGDRIKRASMTSNCLIPAHLFCLILSARPYDVTLDKA
jgi:hypothetical protein